MIPENLVGLFCTGTDSVDMTLQLVPAKTSIFMDDDGIHGSYNILQMIRSPPFLEGA